MDKVAGHIVQKLLSDQEWQIGTTALTVLTCVLCCTYYASDSNEEALRDRIPDEWRPAPAQPTHPYNLRRRHRLTKLGSSD